MVFKDHSKEGSSFTSKSGESFWVIKISLDTLWVALAHIKDGQVKVVESKKRELSSGEGLEGLTEKAKQARNAISSTREVLPKEVFLGVPQSWIEEEGLKKPHLSALTQLASKLELTLVGFVGVNQAVLADLTNRESAPPSVILLEVTKNRLDLTVSKMGQVKAKEREIKDSLTQSLKGTLKEVFTGESLPPRILLFGEEIGEEGKKEILAYPWGETGLFLHLPKVEILPSDLILTAVVQAFRRNLTPGEVSQKSTETELTGEELGFVLEKDIAEEVKKVSEKEKPPLEEELVTPPPSLRVPKFSFTPIFTRLIRLVKNYHLLTLRFRSPAFANLARPALLGGGIIALVLILVLGLYWYLPKAQIVIFAEPQILEKSLSVLVTPRVLEASESAKVVVGTAVKAEVSGVQSLASSGKKMAGDYAKGKVKIFNETLTEKTFLGGTELIGPNNLRFNLGGPVTIDAATISTASGSETKTYGQATCGVTAQDIGSEYNLLAGTEFSFAEYSLSLYSALSEEDFLGGSSREITVVSASDLERLEASLSAKLKEKAKEELIKSLGTEDKVLLPEAIELQVKRKEFSQKIGEEADQVTLTMETLAQSIIYSKGDLRKMLAGHIEKAVPEGFELLAGEMEAEERFVEKSDGSLVLEVYFKANLLPKLDYEKIKADLVGKSPPVAKEYLGKLPSVVGSQVYIWPPLPSRFLVLPHSAGRIKIRVEKK